MRDTGQLGAIKELAHALLEEVESLAEDRDLAAEPVDGGEAEGDFYEMVRAYEKFLIQRALLKSRGNQARAARILRLKPTTLNNKLKSYNISASRRTPACGDGAVLTSNSGSCPPASSGP